MIRSYLLLMLLLLSNCIFAQHTDWRQWMNDPSVPFADVQAAFYAESGDAEGEKHTGWKQYKRWEWFMQQRLNENGERPDQRTVFLEVRKAELQQQYRGSTSNWQLIGPVEEPQNNNGRSIGRISAIAFHPTDTNQMWAGAPAGGIWKSDDNGHSWYPLGDGLPNLGISDIAVHPQHPDTLYISTGDGSSGDTYTYGVLRSADGGATWDTTGLSFGVHEAKNIRRLLLDPDSPNVLIAAGTDGIYRSNDAAQSWQQVSSGNFTDLEFKPGSTDTVYAARGSSGGAAFFISYDNGQTWQPSDNGLNSNDITRMKIAVSAAAPELVFAVTGRSNGGLEGVYRSDNSGSDWTLLSTSDTPNMMAGDEFGSDDGGQAWYSMDIAVSAIDPDQLYIGGINLWRSSDGGSSFTLDAHWYGANGRYVHADQHRLMYHPITGQFYAGNDGGLYRRSYYFDGFESISTGMSITQFYRIGNARSDQSIILGGAQDNGTFRWKNNLWVGIYGGDGMECMVHPTDPNIMYCTTQNGALYKSVDGGNQFSGDLAPTHGAWVTPFMMDPDEPQVIYAASDNKVYRSDASGSSWYELSPNLTNFNSGPLVLFDVCHANTEYLVAGSRRTLWLTTDLGGEWQSILGGLPAINMTYVAFDPLDEQTIWVTMSGYVDGKKVYRSSDAGETWENMTMNLPNLPVNCIEIERSSSGGVYVGTDVGVYYWDRTLSEWEPFMTGLPNVIVNELEIHEATHTIRAATYGRGIWESDTRNVINVGVAEPETEPFMNVSIWPNPATDVLNVRFAQTPRQFSIIDAYGRVVMSGLNVKQKKLQTVDIQRLASGVYYMRSEQNELIGRFIVDHP